VLLLPLPSCSAADPTGDSTATKNLLLPLVEVSGLEGLSFWLVCLVLPFDWADMIFHHWWAKVFTTYSSGNVTIS
jgi:hypothetical protein